jgi:K(+)-stimulated pyrophosphate-energized sodium pump
MISTFAPILLFAAAIWSSYAFSGFYGVAIAASAMMATTAMQLAIDAFGPIADNAGGIAEMSDLPDEVRERTDILDSVGNTTAAIGKGFAIASAALTALALFAAFVTFTGIDGINIFKAPVLAMLFVGGMVPVVFSALAMNAVGKAAMEMVKEVRRQFKEIPGIMEYKAEPEYDKCVAISTEASLKEMMLPGAMTILFPLVVAFLPMAFGYTGQEAAEMLGGYMAGVAVSGVLWAIFQNNAGGAWDNAKKSFEAGVMIDGEMTYKGSEAHKAAVTGDTVGDPFKDTSGPSMNILIKLTCLVGLVIAPILGDGHDSHSEVAQSAPVELRQEVMKMKIKGVEAQVHGPIYQGVVKADMDIAVDSERVLEAVIKFASEDGSFEATFSGAEGIFDGMMFHASGTVTTKDESQFGADVDFHRNENGDVMDFNIAIH